MVLAVSFCKKIKFVNIISYIHTIEALTIVKYVCDCNFFCVLYSFREWAEMPFSRIIIRPSKKQNGFIVLNVFLHICQGLMKQCSLSSVLFLLRFFANPQWSVRSVWTCIFFDFSFQIFVNCCYIMYFYKPQKFKKISLKLVWYIVV